MNKEVKESLDKVREYVGMTETRHLRELLDERGIEYICNDRDEDIYNDRQLETSWSDGRFNYHLVEFFNGESPVTTQFSMGCKYGMTAEQAIAATVGMEPSKEWEAWHASLRHDNPTNVCEAVENILYEAIDFGGDMGPNGNVWSGIDEGTVLTKNCIDGWVKSIESIAATVGDACKGISTDRQEDIVCEFLRKIAPERDWMYLAEVEHAWISELVGTIAATVGAHSKTSPVLSEVLTEPTNCASCPEMDNPDSYIVHLHRALEVADEGAGTLTAEQVRECSKGVYFEGYSDGATHRVNGIEETDWQAIADKLNAMLGAGTCHIEECEHEREIPHDLPDCNGGWYTEVTYDCDECGYENTDLSISFCGGCGRRVVSE